MCEAVCHLRDREVDVQLYECDDNTREAQTESIIGCQLKKEKHIFHRYQAAAPYIIVVIQLFPFAVIKMQEKMLL